MLDRLIFLVIAMAVAAVAVPSPASDESGQGERYQLIAGSIGGGGEAGSGGLYTLTGFVVPVDGAGAGVSEDGSAFDVVFGTAAGLGVPGVGTCTGDVDDDLIIGFSDVLAILIRWGSCPAGPCPEDIGGDGEVGFEDLLVVLGNWGPCP